MKAARTPFWPLLLLPQLLLLLAGHAGAKLPLPDYVRPCSIELSDKRMSECALRSARQVIPKVLKGDPKYNVPSLDPAQVDKLTVIDGNGPLGLQLFTTDLKLYGLSRMIINATTHRSNPQDDTYVATIPELVINAKYNVSGRILLLPIVGQGNINITLQNLRLVYQFDWKLEKLEDGETYYIPQPGARLDADVDGMSVHLDNLFNGDKILTETTNKFLNDEWREVFDSLRPPFAKAFSNIIGDVLNGIFRQVPYKEAFLDVEV